MSMVATKTKTRLTGEISNYYAKLKPLFHYFCLFMY